MWFCTLDCNGARFVFIWNIAPLVMKDKKICPLGSWLTVNFAMQFNQSKISNAEIKKVTTWRQKLPLYLEPPWCAGFYLHYLPVRYMPHIGTKQKYTIWTDQILISNKKLTFKKMDFGMILTENAWVIWTQNSTAIPTDITILTTEIAFNWIPRIAITPCRSIYHQKTNNVAWAYD